MAQATVTVPPPLPRPIRGALRRLGRRLRATAAVRGLGTTALVVAAVAALGMAADFAWPLPPLGRWAAWGLVLAAAGGTLAAKVLAPSIRRVSGLELAALAERAHPELGECLSGAVALLGERRLGRAHGSPALIAALADEAAARAGAIDPARVVPGRAAARRLALGALALGLVAAPGLASRPFGTLARRLLASWSDLERIGWFALAVAPGDRALTQGSDLTVAAHVRPRFGRPPAPDEAWLEWTEVRTGSAHRVAMTEAPPNAPGRSPARDFSATLPRLTGALSYQVVSGSTASRRFRVTVTEPPALTALSERVEPPSYTGLPAVTLADPNPIEAWEGSRITLTATTSAPVRSLEVGIQGIGHQPSVVSHLDAKLSADRRSAAATFLAETSGALTLALRDVSGQRHVPEAPRRLVVRRDEAPTLDVRGGDASGEARPGDVLELDVAARDDVAVASAELHYSVRRGGSASGGPPPAEGRVALNLPGLATPSARGGAALPLGPLALGHGDTLSYRVRVADNRPAPPGPHVVWSPARTLTIAAAAEPLQARRGRAGRGALQAQLDAVKAAAAANRAAAEQLRYAADAALRGNGALDEARQRALRQGAAEARGVADRLQILARNLDGDRSLRPLAAAARRVAEVEAEAGRAALDQARRATDPARRLAELREADARLAAVSGRLDDLQGRFDALASGSAAAGAGTAKEGRISAPRSSAAADPRAPAGRAWGELPPHLRSELLQAAQGRYRSEYARLIRLYFQEIASGARQPGRPDREPAP